MQERTSHQVYIPDLVVNCWRQPGGHVKSFAYFIEHNTWYEKKYERPRLPWHVSNPQWKFRVNPFNFQKRKRARSQPTKIAKKWRFLWNNDDFIFGLRSSLLFLYTSSKFQIAGLKNGSTIRDLLRKTCNFVDFPHIFTGKIFHRGQLS